MPEKKYTIKDVTAMYSVKRRTVYKWIHDGKLKAIKPTGKTFYVTAAALADFDSQR